MQARGGWSSVWCSELGVGALSHLPAPAALRDLMLLAVRAVGSGRDCCRSCGSNVSGGCCGGCIDGTGAGVESDPCVWSAGPLRGMMCSPRCSTAVMVSGRICACFAEGLLFLWCPGAAVPPNGGDRAACVGDPLSGMSERAAWGGVPVTLCISFQGGGSESGLDYGDYSSWMWRSSVSHCCLYGTVSCWYTGWPAPVAACPTPRELLVGVLTRPHGRCGGFSAAATMDGLTLSPSPPARGSALTTRRREMRLSGRPQTAAQRAHLVPLGAPRRRASPAAQRAHPTGRQRESHIPAPQRQQGLLPWLLHCCHSRQR